MQFRKLALVLTVGLAVTAFFAFDLGQYLNLQTLKDQHAAIQAFQANNPLSSVATYFFVYVIVTALSFPGAALLTLAGGAVFGLLWGTVIVSFASSIRSAPPSPF
ncbi:MAG TPA: hypothetical protein PK681_11005 [Steroidobacteraceae bacterium]|nr:hypothetical protein [Steroidobacteraceae bacterium]